MTPVRQNKGSPSDVYTNPPSHQSADRHGTTRLQRVSEYQTRRTHARAIRASTATNSLTSWELIKRSCAPSPPRPRPPPPPSPALDRVPRTTGGTPCSVRRRRRGRLICTDQAYASAPVAALHHRSTSPITTPHYYSPPLHITNHHHVTPSGVAIARHAQQASRHRSHTTLSTIICTIGIAPPILSSRAGKLTPSTESR